MASPTSPPPPPSPVYHDATTSDDPCLPFGTRLVRFVGTLMAAVPPCAPFEAGVIPSETPPPTGVAPEVHPSEFVATPPGRVAIASAARRLLFTVARAEVIRLAANPPLPRVRAAPESKPSATPAVTPAATAAAASHARDVRVASAACLLAVGDYPLAWALRRRVLLRARTRGGRRCDDGGEGGNRLAEREELRRERAFTALVLSAWPGAAAAWAHLANLAATACAEDVLGHGVVVGGEDAGDGSGGDWCVCDRAARAKPANYYAWVHRGRLLCAATGGGRPDGRAVAAREVAYARAFVERHVGDSSGWHYLRRALVAAATVGGRKSRGGTERVASRLTTDMSMSSPGFQAARLPPLVATLQSPAGCSPSAPGSPPFVAAPAGTSVWQCTPAFWLPR
ncbi:hypothetical protein MMPV_002407 [Pyropia vietnamensis]